MRLLTKEEEEKAVSDFLSKMGEAIRIRREKVSISLETMEKCLHSSVSTISKWENAELDMRLSKLFLYSLYCKFPLSDIFPEDTSRKLLATFDHVIDINKQRYSRMKPKKESNVVAHIVVENGKEKRIDRPIKQRAITDSLFQYMVRHGELKVQEAYESFDMMGMVQTEISPDEVFRLMKEYCSKDVQALIGTLGDVLDKTDSMEGANALRGAICDYIIQTVMGNPNNPKTVRDPRLYAYYKEHLGEFGEDDCI